MNDRLHRRVRRSCGLAVMACGFLQAGVAQAQWASQQITLQPGWNSVFLTIDPAPADSNSVFGSQSAITSVWSPVEDNLPPGCTSPDDAGCEPIPGDGWRVWVPQANPNSIVNSLGLVRGGRTYLIRSGYSVNFALTGKPISLRQRWHVGSNLTGFHVESDPQSAPTFQTYLSPSTRHTGARVFGLTPGSGALTELNKATAKISAAVGYWVTASGAGIYDGPVDVDAQSLNGVDFGRSATDHFLKLTNKAAISRTLTVAALNSQAVPAVSGLPALVGAVPIRQVNMAGGSNAQTAIQTVPLPASPIVAAGIEQILRLAVQRNGLASALLGADGSGSSYQSLLQISDGAGYRRLLSATTQVESRTGLWVGSVSINKVNWVNAVVNGDPDPTTVRPTNGEFTFPIIIHVNASNEAKLLQEVRLMWRPGNQTETGKYVLITPDATPSFVATLQPGTLQNGQPSTPRYVTAAYALDDDLTMAGTFGTTNTATLTLPAGHRLNPFKHKYHPDHDGTPTLPGGAPNGELYTITRTMTLTFSADPQSDSNFTGLYHSGLGDTWLVGTYAETVTGLHKDTIRSAGRFELQRASSVAVLNAVAP